MSKEITKEMLFNYFADKATTLQKRRIDEWAKDPQNRELFYEYLALWESQNLQYITDTEAAINRHQTRLAITEVATPASTTKVTTRTISFRWVAAASLLIGILLTGYLAQDKIVYKTFATAYGQTESVVLDDGSQITLNANSSLTVPRFGFGQYTRVVSLKGEANFSVKHLVGNQKFIVKTADGPNVVVLGTEFTVYTRQHGTKVVLNKGKIQLNYQQNETAKNLIMHPGELVTIDTQGKAELTKTPDPEMFSAWKEHRYVFEQTSLRDLCTLFRENFGLNVEIADADISSWTVSGAFMAANAEELLEALAESAGLVYKKENQKIVIHSVTNKSNQ